ncbi:zinc phosphodiesterase ELAC protein 2-like [Saccoglossus kowalevskii]|uniref:ribonuclease Z n=1 Tax=Saccoglossus kowalevskii TaxID=10224 RepID=A0ABM0M6R2_SACKO|nr:PREDICTED: zinc phosphodiesterase ELAC protein 2-like [Saccoglossus kowalevskii]
MAVASISRITKIIIRNRHLNCVRSVFTRRNRRHPNENMSGDGAAATCFLQVVGSGPAHAPPALFLFTDFTNRYLINCGEGTQRMMTEHKMKLSTCDTIFLTSLKWSSIGGLVGMTLTLKDIKMRKATYYGPSGLSELLSATKAFARLAEMEIARKRKRRKSGPIGDVSIAYIFKMHNKPGNILVNKAISLGLKPGPLYGELKRGKTVLTPDGKEVHPADVLTPVVIGPVFIVLECPTEDYLDSLESSTKLNEYLKDDVEQPVSLVVHLTPPEILSTSRYQAWMKRFGEKTDHLVMNSESESHGLNKSWLLQNKLNMICPQIFPDLKGQYTDIQPLQSEMKVDNGLITKAECLMKYHLRPHSRWDRSGIPTVTREQIEKDVHMIPGFTEKLKDLRKTLSHHVNSSNTSELTGTDESDTVKTEMQRTNCVESASNNVTEPNDSETTSEVDNIVTSVKYPEVVFFGTGSAMPSNARNVSSILLNMNNDTSVLMDCGEGTFGQLFRHYGNQTLDIMQRIQCIYISHLHADHHMGLISLLIERKKYMVALGGDVTPLNLVLPAQLIHFLNLYERLFHKILDNVRIIPCRNLLPFSKDKGENEELLHTQLNLEKMETVTVNHFAQPHGLAITHRDGWKIVYSGDTMPCNGLVDIGMNADILIHESTFEDGLEDEALDKRHSTMSQAIDISNQMKAKFVLLTHFSQRYPKIPIIDAKDDRTQKTGIAFDHMKVTIEDLPILPQLVPVLQCLFLEAIMEMEERTFKRTQRERALAE